MQSEDKICTQVPPTIEELDNAMGSTQLSDDEKTAPPSPSLVPKKKKKKKHLPLLVQIPYPMDIGVLEELVNAPVPDWKSLSLNRRCDMSFFIPSSGLGWLITLSPTPIGR